MVNLCTHMHACRQTHTHARTHAHYKVLKLKEFCMYRLPLTNWSCTPFDTKALSSHDYSQQIIYKTAQQCSTRTCPVSNRHNTPQHCTLLHFHSCKEKFGTYFRTFITVMSFIIFFMENWLTVRYVSKMICIARKANKATLFLRMSWWHIEIGDLAPFNLNVATRWVLWCASSPDHFTYKEIAPSTHWSWG